MSPVFQTSTRVLLSCALPFALISCVGDSPTALRSAPSSPDASASNATSLAATGAAHVVNGGGAVWRSDLGVWYHTAVTARVMPNGSASGNWHYWVRGRELRSRIFVKVSCLTVVGNEAWMVGQSSQARNPANVGKWFGLHVVDNGEGSGAAELMSGTAWLGFDAAAAADYCTGAVPTIDWTLADGNFQVR